MTILILGLILFLGLHSLRIFAPGWRDGQYARLGEQKWKGLYSLAAIAAFAIMVWGYALARPDAPVLYEPPVWMKHVNATLMLLAFIFVATNQRPAGRIKSAVKHPMLVATKLWALGHLMANGDLASVLLFGSFLVWAVADRISLKRRPAAVSVPGTWKDDAFAVVGGLVLYGLFTWKLHAWLFGVTPF